MHPKDGRISPGPRRNRAGRPGFGLDEGVEKTIGYFRELLSER